MRTGIPFYVSTQAPEQCQSTLSNYFALLNIRSAQRLANLSKRCLDLIGAITGIILLSPLMLLIATLVKLEDGGPIFFKQQRVGKLGMTFTCFKFRSMSIDAEKQKLSILEENRHGSGITFKMKTDPRITRIGRLTRKLSIDELPQLWNVVRGEMSIVGPRPPIPSEVARYTQVHRRRLEAKPGLTCIWQVSGRADIPFPRQVLMDIEYVEKQSLFADIMLILRTFPAVLLGKGAY